jgi:hypothetical protein
MNKRNILSAVLISLSVFCSIAGGQPVSPVNQDWIEQKAQPPPRPPRSPRPAKPSHAPRPSDIEEEAQPVQDSMKLERGGKVTISNHFGVISVNGYDGDTVEATAINMRGVGFDKKASLIKGDSSRMRISVEGAYGRRQGREIEFQIKVPRYATLEIVESQETTVEIDDLDGAVNLASGSGDVRVNRVGSVAVDWQRGDVRVTDVKGRCSVKIFTGDVTIQNVAGLVDVSSINGELRVVNAGGDVKANAVSGEVYIHCAKGRVDARSVSGSIELLGITGNVDSETVSGENVFKGNIQTEGAYRMKSLSGEVAMHIQSDAPGFTITLTTFNGDIETVFPIKVDSAIQQGDMNRRIVGRYGNGQAKISLDSFSAGVRIVKIAASEVKECK